MTSIRVGPTFTGRPFLFCVGAPPIITPFRKSVVAYPCTHLGPYQVTARIGAGGMGEVYKATDTRLGREVAIKVLPTEVASSPELASVSSAKPGRSRSSVTRISARSMTSASARGSTFW